MPKCDFNKVALQPGKLFLQAFLLAENSRKILSMKSVPAYFTTHIETHY